MVWARGAGNERYGPAVMVWACLFAAGISTLAPTPRASSSAPGWAEEERQGVDGHYLHSQALEQRRPEGCRVMQWE